MRRMALWLGLSAGVVVLDQLSKLWVLSAFNPGQSVEVTSFFNLVLVYNPGAAFSFLSDAAGWQRWFFVALALAISAWLVTLIRFHRTERMMPLAASLILGGALGNVIDRVLYGAVVDFLDAHAAGYHWPAFNVADSAISLGVALLVWQQVFGHRAAARS
jgi:signal peptidase II